MSLTARIAERALALTLDQIPEASRAIAVEAILDTLACGLAGSREPVAAAVRAQLEADGGRELSAVWGSTLRSSPAQAALANGTAAHALDYDDICWAMDSHASAVLVPTALAVAEAYGASGAHTLLAYIAGFEAQAWIGGALGRAHYQRGWHATATLGALGSTITATRLIGLDADATRRALGLASSMVAGSRMQFGTDAKPLHAGLAASAGTRAAQLAARGVGARTDALEAPMGVADLYGGAFPPGELDATRFALEEPGLELKPYPSCRFTHRIIDAVLEVRERLTGEPEHIECAINPFARSVLIHERARTGLEAKFCLAYCAAVAWLDGWPTTESFADERVTRADVQRLCERVSVIDADGGSDTDRVTIRVAGRTESAAVRVARGHRRRPMSRDERLAKVRDLVGPERTEALVSAVESLHELGSIAALAGILAAN